MDMRTLRELREDETIFRGALECIAARECVGKGTSSITKGDKAQFTVLLAEVRRSMALLGEASVQVNADDDGNSFQYAPPHCLPGVSCGAHEIKQLEPHRGCTCVTSQTTEHNDWAHHVEQRVDNEHSVLIMNQ